MPAASRRRRGRPEAADLERRRPRRPARRAGRGGAARATPDVVCLQEVTATTLPRWREALGPSRAVSAAEQRRLAVLLPAATSRRRREVERPGERPGRPVGRRADRRRARPQRGQRLGQGHDARRLGAHIAGRDGPRILCGDLNTPRARARRRHGAGRSPATEAAACARSAASRWDEGERAPWRGAGRRVPRLHPPGDEEVSWAWPQRRRLAARPRAGLRRRRRGALRVPPRLAPAG